MLDFQIPRITAESVEDNRGSFTVEPLDRETFVEAMVSRRRPRG